MLNILFSVQILFPQDYRTTKNHILHALLRWKRFMYRPTMETHNFPKTTAGQKTKIKAVNMAYFELLQFIES